jgi:hypothetical protein
VIVAARLQAERDSPPEERHRDSNGSLETAVERKGEAGQSSVAALGSTARSHEGVALSLASCVCVCLDSKHNQHVLRGRGHGAGKGEAKKKLPRAMEEGHL